VGLGYSVAPNRASDILRKGGTFQFLGRTMRSGFFVDASAGMSYDVNEKASLLLDFGYRYWLEAKKQTVNTNVGVMINF
ncbi:MAG: hypothetical protein KBS81_02290, partial [Spirochaetales bacterium]|nr:hypothetical protein [Candidatus Physcosoma equi]